MNVRIGGQEITLVDRDVRAAREMIRHFLETSRTEAEKQKATTFYYTLLIVMNVMSTNYLQKLTPEFAATLLNAAAKTEELRSKQDADE